MSGVVGKAKEIVGHRHILTFSDGPRTCLGKGFALANFKVCLFFSFFVFAFLFLKLLMLMVMLVMIGDVVGLD